MLIVPVSIPLSKTGGLNVTGSIKVNENITLELVTVSDEKSYDQNDFMLIISKVVFENHSSWSMGKKMAVIKYFRTMGSRAELQERGVMITHLSEIMNTAAARYESYCKARGNKRN